jgi:hypothetical protein
MLFILQSSTDEEKWNSECNCGKVFAIRSHRRQYEASEKLQLAEDNACLHRVSRRDLHFHRLLTN